MIETSQWVYSDDGTGLFVRRWQVSARPGAGPEEAPAAPKGIVHLVHGMAEHSLRYRALAEALTERGFELWAADQRGHGRTADPSVNDPGRGGLLGHTGDSNGFFRVVADIGVLNRHIAQSCGIDGSPSSTPLFLMGHSWGSFLVQGYIESFISGGPSLRGCILSGTRGPGGAHIAFGALFLKILAALKGCRRGSKLAHALADGSYNKPFAPNRTPFDWLSRDENEVDRYIADPLCGQLCSAGFYRDMIGGLKAVHRAGAMKKIPADLRVYVFCGSADPVGEMGASPTKLVNAYRTNGIEDLQFVIYPDARHETLNETNKNEVTGALLKWLEQRL
ncbi:MAG: lysophospholipase [Treponema sp.]|jgi:alpha-beta hydrolase superfamily lysophospholipase|nr:lysophospholipase [Treponema sp.]